ncbi:MAG: PemK family transcriptional regulator [Omnitrophica bacterium RIFCSPLOWO2_12_FULL_44_17]|uniref:mRNA interferase n=1 Tax=Candidatus Danuiimicrobium aquiferis TaxID=1801832 RepID=A0A1G1KZF9_9BACT|nr:MAG: PemK family transcriptional regulator [Omnitrophica bacterium RIFCSPHIGHO2_02_FULL_45_28]OGW89123.1 MAG: PemK family transcriptional regulator [Omnitrophica bacterium RIFCSPHIGHO2_12_FULL_44_12]OGW98288.1 MAG: PemK family transcriptional regulator [Omnitrophica bacterium RIFCSPLOWO2_12_FULL_44_17]OGX02882.1 MAG: PemK family transcriptional regulator [Omnitrophica bacterium RIFCSPLOWO2_02_FULL_44_11]
MPVKRGNLFWVNLNPTRGSEQAGRRPVLVIQNDIGNEIASTVIIAPLTTKSFSKEYPTNVNLPKSVSSLKSDSTILLSQIRTIDKRRLEKKIGHLPQVYLEKVNEAIKISLALS